MNAAIAVIAHDSSSLNWALDWPVQRAQQPPAIRLDGIAPPWFGTVAYRIAELDALPKDPRGSRELNIEDLIDALRFLADNMRDTTLVPWMGRLNTGGVQLAWHVGDIEVEAVFDRARDEQQVIVTVGENEWDAPAMQAYSLFASVVERLSADHLES